MITRRQFLEIGASVSAYALPSVGGPGALAWFPSEILDPKTIPKYAMRLIVPPAMPRSGTWNNGAVDYYRIGVRQFRQRVLPPSLPKTIVWGYGSIDHPWTFSYPACTIEARTDRPVRVKWINELVDASGRFLPHLFAVDPTLHWANPPGGIEGRDQHPSFNSTPGPYLGPVPFVTHLHGAHTYEESDGYPEAWYLPAARDIPDSYATVGSFYERFKDKFESKFGYRWHPGCSISQYPNDQRATTLWFHDHALGLTRVNVYAGPVGFYLLRGGASDLPRGALPGSAPGVGDQPHSRHYEVPMVIQDKSFNQDGSLFFPSSRAFFGDVPPNGPFIPKSDISPIWNPEFFGKTIVVNGRTWPVLHVEPRRYRLRLLNACNSRFLILKIAADPLARRPATPVLPFWQIGSDGGFVRAPTQLAELLVAPAERFDVIVDFTGVPVGSELYLINEGPDEPFGGGRSGTDFIAADPSTTGQVMKFVTIPLADRDTSVPPGQLALPTLPQLGTPQTYRKVSLNEAESAFIDEAPSQALLGTVEPGGQANPLTWMDKITERETPNQTEMWEIFNFTEDAHPIHVHQIQFQVLGRKPFSGESREPERWEQGYKDTVIAYPGEITRIKGRFDLPGRYVWHCHILDHEDNEMMRPYQVGPEPADPERLQNAIATDRKLRVD